MKKSFDLPLTGGLILIMCSLVFVAKYSAWRAQGVIDDLKEVEVVVTITGAVKRPGEYVVAAGTPIGMVLKKAGVGEMADLGGISLGKPVGEALVLHVEELKEVSVKMVGAVREEVELKLPVGSRVCDLKSKVLLTDGADETFFRRRKLLKNGDIVAVPNKTVE